jgi:DNA polymerase III sliding clamp (beta) subunit (PCNA family)
MLKRKENMTDLSDLDLLDAKLSTRGDKKAKRVDKDISEDLLGRGTSFPSNRVIQTVAVQTEREFRKSDQAFQMCTQVPKRIALLLTLLNTGDSGSGNLHFGTNGINVYTLTTDQTVCITVQIGRNIFSTFKCDKEVVFSLNLKVLSDALKKIQQVKADTITFSNDEETLILTGNRADKTVISCQLHSNDRTPEELVPVFEYPVYLSVKAKDLSDKMDAMPTQGSFCIRMDCDNRRLIFEGKEDCSRTTVFLAIPEDIVAEIRRHSDQRSYSQVFLKNSLSILTRAHRLNTDTVIIGFSNKSPLFVRYIVNRATDHKPEHETNISMYFAAQHADDD